MLLILFFIAKSINDVIGTTNFKGDRSDVVAVEGQRRHAVDIALVDPFPAAASREPIIEKGANESLEKSSLRTSTSSNSSLVDRIDYVLSRTSTTGSLASNVNNSEFSKTYVHRTVHEKPIHHIKGAAAKVV